MEKASNLIGALAARFVTIPGECQEHGPSDVLVLKSVNAWHCPKCFEAQIAATERANWERERSTRLMQIARIPGKYAGQRFVAHTAAQKTARGVAKTFRDFIVQERRWAALILMGEVGTGKTLLACEFAESFIANLSRSVRYITAKGMISEIQSSYGMEGKSEECEIERFSQYDLLILDEIDALPAKDNAALLLTEIINRRYSNDKPVIVITNQPFDDLARFVGDRVDDRLHENAFVCAFDWPSFRRNPAPALKAVS